MKYVYFDNTKNDEAYKDEELFGERGFYKVKLLRVDTNDKTSYIELREGVEFWVFTNDIVEHNLYDKLEALLE